MNSISKLLLVVFLIFILTPVPSPADVVWGPDERLTNNPFESSGPSVTCDLSSGIHVVWSDYRDGNSEIYYKRSDGDGWTPDLRLTQSAGHSQSPVVVSDQSSNIHVVWDDNRDENSETYYKRWDGVAWTPDLRLTENAAVSADPEVATDSSGNVHVAWYDHRAGGGNSEIYYKRWDGVAWTPDLRLTQNAAYSFQPAVVSDPSGNVHVVWLDYRDGTSGEIYYMRWDGVGWMPELRLTQNADVSDHPVVACDPNGNIHVVWIEGNNNDYVIYYKRWDGVAWTLAHRLTESPPAAGNPAIASDSYGNVHVVWESLVGHSEIFYKRWDGSAWTQDYLLTSSQYYAFPSVASDPVGNVHLVWQDYRDGNGEIYYKLGNRTTVGVDEQAQASAQAELMISHPNPFRTSTTISFSNMRTGRMHLSIYDSSGRLVARPFDQVIGPGEYETRWDGRSHNGSELAAGVYFYRLSGESHLTNRLVLTR